MSSIKYFISFSAAISTFVYTLYVVTQLVQFLSAPRRTSKIYTWVFDLLDNKSRMETAYGPMVFNTLYLIIFIFQHSCMKSSLVKRFFNALGLDYADRIVYNLTSSLSLHYLMKNWLTASSIILWQVDVEKTKCLWWSFVSVHTIAWLTILGGGVIMDLPEIIGFKQVFYKMKRLGDPMAYKSRELRKYLNRVRHPSFIGFIVIFWATNWMTLDRLLLAVLLSFYMYFAWSPSNENFVYQKYQLTLKQQELKSQ